MCDQTGSEHTPMPEQIERLEIERDHLRATLNELRDATRDVMPYLDDMDSGYFSDDEAVGWYGDGTEMPLTFGQIRRLRNALGGGGVMSDKRELARHEIEGEIQAYAKYRLDSDRQGVLGMIHMAGMLRTISPTEVRDYHGRLNQIRDGQTVQLVEAS